MSVLFSTSIISMALLTLTQAKKTWTSIIQGLVWLSFLSLTLMPQDSFISLSAYSTLDTLSTTMIILTFLISSLMISASQKYLINSTNPMMFNLAVLTLAYILILCYSTNHLINFYIMFEASLIPTLILILGWGYQPERLQAGTYLMMYMIFTSLPLLFSLLLIMKMNGHLFTTLPNWISPKKYITLWWFLTIFPFLVKTPLYSVHLWLPKAHVEAPVSGSMILAGILLKLGSYGLFRLYTQMYFSASHLATPIMALSLWGACIASLLCLRQTDMKALIAYSSISHMGLATAGILTLNLWGWSGALMLMIAHGLVSSALFALANMTYETSFTRNLNLIKGLMNIFPAFTIWWFLLSASNLGAPPTINMVAETILISATISYSFTSMVAIFMMVMFTTAYCLLIFSTTQYGPLSSYINPWFMNHSRNHSILLIHMFPAAAFFLKPEMISLWSLYVKNMLF